jgi:uncharacterized protein YegJ (DUF2314 family)
MRRGRPTLGPMPPPFPSSEPGMRPPRGTRLPVQPLLEPALYVYFVADPERPSTRQPPLPPESPWLAEHVPEPLLPAVTEHRRCGLVRAFARTAREMPPLPFSVLEGAGMGELEERVLRAATHALLISAADLNVPPRIGLTSALAAASEAADQLAGVIVDPDALCVIRPEPARRALAASERVVAALHVLVSFSVDERGAGWMTTRGMCKFGLPELEVRDVPPNLQLLAVPLRGCAQLLIERAFQAVADHGPEARYALLEPAVRIDAELLARACQSDSAGACATGSALVGLSFDGGRPDPAGEPMVRLLPPPGFAGEMGVWLHALMAALYGPSPEMASLRPDSQAARRGHARALAELPRVKARFQDGLKPGELLFVKHPFPSPARSPEYLWLVVNEWSGTSLIGQLVSRPRRVPGLRQGQRVVVGEPDVFDWLLQLPRQRQEGGYTSRARAG